MKLFRAGGDEFDSSVAIGTSKVGRTLVCVGVAATRDAEIAVLDGLCWYGGDWFTPFYDEVEDLEARAEFTEKVITANWEFISAAAYRWKASRRVEEQWETAITASLVVDDLLDASAESLVLVNGDEATAEPYADALAAWRDEPLPVANLERGPQYYPTMLLARLAARRFAAELNDGAAPSPSIPWADDHDAWGEIHGSVRDTEGNGVVVSLPNRRTNRVQGRIECWYEGAGYSGGRFEQPSSNVEDAVAYVRSQGYDRLAKVLADS